MSTFIKNTLITRIGEDVARYPRCWINVTVDDVHPGSTGWHSDFVEITGGYSLQQLVMYNVLVTDCNAQGIFTKASPGQLTTFKDSAFINVVLHKVDGFWLSQYDTDSLTDNVLQLHCSWANFTQLVKEDTIVGLYYDMCQFAAYDDVSPGVVDTDWFDRCHFNTGTEYGTNSSTGDPLWEDAAGHDFAPATGSPLLARGTAAFPYDLYGQLRPASAAVGAIEVSSADPLGGGASEPEPPDPPADPPTRVFAYLGA
jgi:hypothetical protein